MLLMHGSCTQAWLPLGMPGCPWVCLAAPGVCLAAPGYAWLPLGMPGCPWVCPGPLTLQLLQGQGFPLEHALGLLYFQGHRCPVSLSLARKISPLGARVREKGGGSRVKETLERARTQRDLEEAGPKGGPKRARVH